MTSSGRRNTLSPFSTFLQQHSTVDNWQLVEFKVLHDFNRKPLWIIELISDCPLSCSLIAVQVGSLHNWSWEFDNSKQNVARFIQHITLQWAGTVGGIHGPCSELLWLWSPLTSEPTLSDNTSPIEVFLLLYLWSGELLREDIQNIQNNYTHTHTHFNGSSSTHCGIWVCTSTTYKLYSPVHWSTVAKAQYYSTGWPQHHIW